MRDSYQLFPFLCLHFLRSIQLWGKSLLNYTVWNAQIHLQNIVLFALCYWYMYATNNTLYRCNKNFSRHDVHSSKRVRAKKFVIVLKFFPKSLFCCYDSALSFLDLVLVSICQNLQSPTFIKVGLLYVCFDDGYVASRFEFPKKCWIPKTCWTVNSVKQLFQYCYMVLSRDHDLIFSWFY